MTTGLLLAIVLNVPLLAVLAYLGIRMVREAITAGSMEQRFATFLIIYALLVIIIMPFLIASA